MSVFSQNNFLDSMLETLSMTMKSTTPKSVYELYKEQEQQTIQAALINSERIKAQGEIELRNLQYKHSIQRGADVTRVAAAGGNLSGSFLDVLMQKAKFQTMDETTVSLNTSNAMSQVLRDGYLTAATYAMNAKIRAEGDKRATAGAIIAGVQKYFKNDQLERIEKARQEKMNSILEYRDTAFSSLMLDKYGEFFSNAKTQDEWASKELDDVYNAQTNTLRATAENKPKPRFGLLGGFGDLTETSLGTGGINQWA